MIEDGFDDVVRHSEYSLKKIWDNEGTRYGTGI